MRNAPTSLETLPAAAATRISGFDNLHVLLWLIKDTCWMLEWRVLGTAMILPTVAVAVTIAVRSRFDRVFWINLAICFWIAANSYWMLVEFLGHEDLKMYAGIPFACGFAAVALFYLKPARASEHRQQIGQDPGVVPNGATKSSP